MIRLLVVILVLSTAGVLISDAQCAASCSTRRCGAPPARPACHHRTNGANDAPPVSQCLHQFGITHAWLRPAAVSIAADRDGQAATVATVDQVVSAMAERTISDDSLAFEPPGTPQHTTLRI